ncbi:hypothetical protein HD597_011216 [Nonomuraea thailandensis]|uniref:Uncharacterized protein n=1 Tax=Nonomuraea thailandensis TaxID=1188745 RepID=A0A9X2KBP3_9ACTN|nr:hypothetical protein [Nonomuraea thailandensis]MCP2364196.1 hypothetical protein [Nonomuraea thailandensis]
MMATQEQIAAARRTIEQVCDQHTNDVRKLISLLQDGAMKGKAADKLLEDCQAWEAAYRGVFNRALALVESARPDPAKPTDPLGLWPPPLNLPGKAGG